MTDKNQRHRLSHIIATLGPSTDDEKELITMLMAGIARQWTDGVDLARVLHSDGEDIAKNDKILLIKEKQYSIYKKVKSFLHQYSILKKLSN